jgi:hypothetical protein
MWRSHSGPVIVMAGVFAASSHQGAVGLITTAAVMLVLALVDLRSNLGKAIAGEAFWLGLVALNISSDSRSALYLLLDVVWVLAGSAFIVWLYRRAEGASSRRQPLVR